MSLESAIFIAAVNGNELSPKISKSLNYKHWLTEVDWKRCYECETKHGEIFSINEVVEPEPPIHPNCRCRIEIMNAIQAGTATVDGYDGADWSLKYNNELPDYYVTKEEAEANGWKSSKWLSNFVPNKMLTRGQYYNDDGHLPSAPGRVWYEADINYKTGKRNDQRIVWSNDGLIFVTYDHYGTFYEIVQGGKEK